MQRVVFVVYAKAKVVERWVFDVQGFPTEGWGMVEEEDENAVVQAPGEDSVNWTDVQEALRGALRRIAYAAESRPELPPGCTFTLAVELRDGAPAPIGVSKCQYISGITTQELTVVASASMDPSTARSSASYTREPGRARVVTGRRKHDAITIRASGTLILRVLGGRR